MYYKYWNDFVIEWQKGNILIGDWSNPDLIPLYNDSVGKSYSSLYVPEPWWGNDDTTPLHSVIINHNPGRGNDTQKRCNMAGISSYSKDVVCSGILPNTDCWHCSKRALPILNSLKRLGYISGPIGVHNHLSVELIPWHTKGVDSNYWTYIRHNAKAIYDNVICFAANESSRIANKRLRSIVLLRMNEKSINELLKIFEGISISSNIVTKRSTTKSGKAHFLEFSINARPDNRFVALWGTQTHNNLPQADDLDEILQSI